MLANADRVPQCLHPENLGDSEAMVAMIEASWHVIATTMTTHLVSRTVKDVRPADPDNLAPFQSVYSAVLERRSPGAPQGCWGSL